MNQFIDNSISTEVFSYRNKGYLSRFLLVYSFVLKRSATLLWHYKVMKRVLSPEKIQKREEAIYSKLGKDCKDLFLNLGGVYIKLGQFLSNMGHVLPDYFISAFQDLQDRIPPHSFEEIKLRFYKETGKDIKEVFPEIDKSPLAAASTAQVYKAKLGEEKVVIKILYPGIEKLVEKDLRTVLFVMKRINRYLVTYDFKQIHSEVATIITREMDLSEEAKSIEKMASYFAFEKDYVFPAVYHEYTTKGILVTKFIEGVKISETRSVARRNARKSRPLDLLVRAYILMVFQYRFFHADPHSGNLIYTTDGKLCFVDFGAVSEVNEITAISLKKIISSAMSKDYYGVIEGMEEMGFFDKNVNKEKLEQIVKFALEKLERFISNTDFFRNISFEQLNPEEAYIFLKGINSSLSDLLKIARVPSNYVMLERTLGLIMGNIAILDPYRSVFDYGENYFQTIAIGETGLIEKMMSEEGKELLATSLQIPSELHKALLTLNRGRLVIHNKDIEKQTVTFSILGSQFIYTLVSISSVYFGNYFLGFNQQYPSLFFYSIASISGLSLLHSLIKNRPGKK
ncbi:MAG: AarF/ABC1/UbiB kinase family protein [Leptospiraceae bacterium]|nr:AarF/ABC1/UbiB kinase family protein [Leptospiraceae bacterium]